MLVGRRLKKEKKNWSVETRSTYSQLLALHNISCRGNRKYPRGSITRLGRTSNCWGRLFRQRYSRTGDIPGPPFDPARCYKWSYKAIFWWKQTWSRRVWLSSQLLCSFKKQKEKNEFCYSSISQYTNSKMHHTLAHKY